MSDARVAKVVRVHSRHTGKVGTLGAKPASPVPNTQRWPVTWDDGSETRVYLNDLGALDGFTLPSDGGAPQHLHGALDVAWDALAPLDSSGAVQTTEEEDAAVVAELQELQPDDLARAQLALLLVRALGEHVRLERAGWL